MVQRDCQNSTKMNCHNGSATGTTQSATHKTAADRKGQPEQNQNELSQYIF